MSGLKHISTCCDEIIHSSLFYNCYIAQIHQIFKKSNTEIMKFPGMVFTLYSIGNRAAHIPFGRLANTFKGKR